MYGSYNGYQFTYEILPDGRVKVSSAFRGNFQCSYGKEFESMDDLKRFIDSGGWGLKKM